MVEQKVLTTALGNKITVHEYGDWRFSSWGGKVLMAPEYSFNSLGFILDEIRAAQHHNYDRVILLTGDERDGKSTLAAWIATKLGFTDPKQVSFDSQTFYNRLTTAEDYQTAWYDEGARGLYSRDAMTAFQRRLCKSLTQIGIKKLVSIICLPHRMLIDKHMRERRIHYWGHVVSQGYRRGFVKWRTPRKNEWDITAFWGPLFVMQFPKFRESNGFDWNVYEKLKRAALTEYLEDSEADRTRYSKKAVSSLVRMVHSLQEGKKTIKEIAEMGDMSERNVYKYLKIAQDSSK